MALVDQLVTINLVLTGTGVGGALVEDGVRFEGASGCAGEIGHIMVEAGGRMCGCGQPTSIAKAVSWSEKQTSSIDAPFALCARAAVGLPHIVWGKVVYAAALVPFAALVLCMRRP